MVTLSVSILAYLVGSIPSGYLVARACGIDDIRQHGSGNIGATNVARVLGKKFFIIVLLLDFAKAYGFLFFVSLLVPLAPRVIAAGALLLGNAFPVFLHFKGGKGVATSLGILAALNPWLIIASGFCWAATFVLTQTVGIASVVGLITLPIFAGVARESASVIILMVCMAILGVWLHRNNIRHYVDCQLGPQ